MPEHDVNLIGTRIGFLITDANALRAAGSASAPALMLMTRLRLQAIRIDTDGERQRPVTPLSVVHASAFVNIRGAEEFAHSLTADVDLETMNLPRPVDAGITFRFPLTAAMVHQIEQARAGGDMQFDFRIRLRLAVHETCEEAPETSRSRGSVSGLHRTAVERFATTYTQVVLEVPKSTWARDFLPALGFGKRHVVEIAVPPPPDDARFERARGHLDAAWAALAAGDASTAMARCWVLWETVMVEFLGAGRTPQREAFEELLRRGNVPAAKAEKLKALLYDLAAFNHLGRHDREAAPTPLDNRDAELALMGTHLALGYLSRVGAFTPPQP